MNDDLMKLIIGFCAVLVVSIFNNLAGSFFLSRRPDFVRSFTVPENLIRYWIGSVSTIMVVLLVAMDQSNGLASVGLLTGPRWIGANSRDAFIGFFSFCVLIDVILGFQILIRRLRKKPRETKLDLSNPAVANVTQYQDAFKLLAYLSVMPVMVIAEDLVYRGYLVLMLGNITHTFIPWTILSIALSVTIHLHQGRKINNIGFHIGAAAFFIGLTIATRNILAPIAAHLFYDIFWTISTWRKAKSLEPQLFINPGKKNRLAYSAFIVLNAALLFGALFFVSYAR